MDDVNARSKITGYSFRHQIDRLITVSHFAGAALLLLGLAFTLAGCSRGQKLKSESSNFVDTGPLPKKLQPLGKLIPFGVNPPSQKDAGFAGQYLHAPTERPNSNFGVSLIEDNFILSRKSGAIYHHLDDDYGYSSRMRPSETLLGQIVERRQDGYLLMENEIEGDCSGYIYLGRKLLGIVDGYDYLSAAFSYDGKYLLSTHQSVFNRLDLNTSQNIQFFSEGKYWTQSNYLIAGSYGRLVLHSDWTNEKKERRFLVRWFDWKSDPESEMGESVRSTLG